MENPGLTAQGSAVIAATEFPAPSHLIEGKSQSVLLLRTQITVFLEEIQVWQVITEPHTHTDTPGRICWQPQLIFFFVRLF